MAIPGQFCCKLHDLQLESISGPRFEYQSCKERPDIDRDSSFHFISPFPDFFGPFYFYEGRSSRTTTLADSDSGKLRRLVPFRSIDLFRRKKWIPRFSWLSKKRRIFFKRLHSIDGFSLNFTLMDFSKNSLNVDLYQGTVWQGTFLWKYAQVSAKSAQK